MTQQTAFFASYKGIYESWHGLINHGIRWADKSIYSHSEICLGNPFGEVTTCISSTVIDDGVPKKEPFCVAINAKRTPCSLVL